MKETRHDRFQVFGHRGSTQNHRENTLGAFRASLEEDADGIETDLRRLKDGTIVLFHDSTVGGKPLAMMDRDEFGEQVPEFATLGDLDELREKGILVLEVKEPGLEDQIVEMVEGWPKVVVCSFDHGIIETLSGRGVDFELGLTVREYRRDLADRVPDLGAQWFFPRWDVIDDDVVNVFHEAGAKVVAWTANRPTQWSRLVDIGCDGVITDVPAVAAIWRQERF